MSAKRDIEVLVKAFNERQIGRMAYKVHAAMVVVKGIAGAPELAEVSDEIGRLIEWSKEKKAQEEVYFWGTNGFIMYVNRNGSPWPTYTFFVPATSNMYVRDEETE